ncbi:Arylsulfatase A [Fodinibius roseus]|uniref:Arylsulfatase A n=1 Tax=Fodinibius roseus TaxID=1194090 RepID=A0A1M5BK91_9BACT|nr:sulfatase [Fodinibius roseus]SHF42964.1 Arylsulfatase A [Fodinibius roseus]
MSTAKTIFIILLASVLLFSCSQKSEETENTGEGKRPNIIFIMTDDQATRTVSAYEGAINSTPNIDRLAEEGAVFRNSFVANSICNPSRAAILTGKHSHKNGVVGNASSWDNRQANLPRLLQDAGYTTALIGKWHMNNPPGDEFDYSDRLTGAGKQGFYYNPEFVTGDADTSKAVQGHSTDLVTGKALLWLTGHTGRQQDPFMLFVQYKAPHVPRMPEFRFLDRYQHVTIPEPPTLFDDYDTREPYAEKANMNIHYNPLPPLEEHDPCENIYYDRMTQEQLRRWHRYKDPEAERYRERTKTNGKELRKFEYQLFIKDYLRLIDGVDENVGRLLDWLEEHPEIRDNTVVVFTSDQGFFTGEHGWAEKRFMYEESLTMPLLMRWPGHIKPGSSIDAMVQNIDFAPTFLDLADTKISDDMQGRSFAPLLEGETPDDWRQSIYYHYYDHGLHGVPRHDGVRTGRYKLIHFYTDDVWEFYDLEKDPREVENQYGDQEYEETIKELKEELDRLRNYYEVPAEHFQPPYVTAGQDQKL